MMINTLTRFRFWCQKVIPLVYDDSLSYYEVLCKVVEYINNLIAEDKLIEENITELQNDMEVVQKWIEDFDTSYAEQIIKDAIATMIFVEINDEGYIVYYIPENWTDIDFGTTGYDTEVSGVDYGHLTLNY